MSGDYTHDKRPADAGPVEQLDAPVSELAVPTPSVVPVAGIAGMAQRPIARRAGTAADPLGGTSAAPDVVDALRRRRGGGSPLPQDVASRFGEQLGTDLSAVRVHTDSEADGISRSVGAQAFTHGSDIYFTSGTYNTGASGQRLLAHELAHVAQNAEGRFRPSGSGTQIGRADDPAERDADHTADHVVSALRRTALAPPELGPDAAGVGIDSPIRRDVAQLTKWHEEKIAGAGGSGYATEMKDLDRPDGAYSTPDLSEEKEAGRPDGAYSTPELSEEKEAEAEAGGGEEHAAKVYSEFKPGEGGGGRPANAYAEKIEEGKVAGGHAYSQPDLKDDAGEAEAEEGGGEAGGAAGGGSEATAEEKQIEELLKKGDQEAEEEEKAEEHAEGGEKAPEGGAGTSRQHRGWLLSELDASYKGEEGTSSQSYASVLKPHLDRVALYWTSLQQIDALPDRKSAGYAAKAAKLAEDIKAKIFAIEGNWGKAFHAEVKDFALPALTTALLHEHARCRMWLSRQDLPVRNDGSLNLRTVTVGGKEQYDMSGRVLKYMSEEERTAAQVAFAGGVLKRDAGWKPSTRAGVTDKEKKEAKGGGEPGGAIPVDTDKSVTHFSGPGWEIFVVSPDGDLYMTSHKIGMMHHSSLLGGKPVMVAGEIKASHGRIVEMSNKSGHYLPSPDQLAQFLHYMQKDGIPVNFKVSGFGVGVGRTGADLLAGRDAKGVVDPLQTFDQMKTRTIFKAFLQEYDQEDVMAVIAAKGWHLNADKTQFLDEENKQVDPKLIRTALKTELEKDTKVKAKRTFQQRKMNKGKPELDKMRWEE